jgi:hypothetical protein
MPFMVMSNELGTAKILYCTSDAIHSTGPSLTFAYATLDGAAAPALNTHVAVQSSAGLISYFINGDATEADSQAILSGDLNIGNQNSTAGNNYSNFRFGASATTQPSVPEAVQINTVAYGAANFAWAWTQNDLHQKTGNLGLCDGSVQSATIGSLHTYLQNSTNIVAQPCFNFPM